jgi:hypothetical protein
MIDSLKCDAASTVRGFARRNQIPAMEKPDLGRRPTIRSRPTRWRSPAFAPRREAAGLVNGLYPFFRNYFPSA